MLSLRALLTPVALLAMVSAAPPLLLTERIVEDDIRAGLPLGPCAVPAIAGRIIRSMRIAAGIEPVPEPCGDQRRVPIDPKNELVLTGLTLRDALDRITRLDPRYAWTETGGVIVLRPSLAWNDRNHFLHRTIHGFTLNDERLGDAFDAIRTGLGPLRSTFGAQLKPKTPEADHQFSVALRATSAIGALNAVVHEHGASWWSVRYCESQPRYEYATIELHTFDGGGLGARAAALGADGRWFDACAASAGR